jgi:glycosyltransferase A (GT-A) superfamily protein (DUF2064 family)
MFKAPERSKRRLRAAIGPHAEIVAAHMCACALEDMRQWPGPRCMAAATADDLEWAKVHMPQCEHWLIQPEGNLGTRIAAVNAALLAAGATRQIFIGTDCPTLDQRYLQQAAQAMDEVDVVLGPALDGGVVLMGVRGAWPPLDALPWSTPELMHELRTACHRSNLSVAELASRSDVDSAADLDRLRRNLAADGRPARIALRECLEPMAAAR